MFTVIGATGPRGGFWREFGDATIPLANIRFGASDRVPWLPRLDHRLCHTLPRRRYTRLYPRLQLPSGDTDKLIVILLLRITRGRRRTRQHSKS